jgi:MoxR-like ATPase
MRETIEAILRSYNTFTATQKFAGNHKIKDLFTRLRSDFENIELIKANSHLTVSSSYGKGNWAKVPWLAILDTRETTTTQDGTYVVLLFSEDGRSCQLKLAQGVTQVEQQFKRHAPGELEKRAVKVREQLRSYEFESFIPGEYAYNLGDSKKAQLYAASTILSKEYSLDTLPLDSQLLEDVTKLIEAYQTFIKQKLSRVRVDESEVDTASTARVWAISVGEGGRLWEEFRAKGQIAIGWSDISDLKAYKTHQNILDEMRNITGGNPSNDALCCYQFAHEIAEGDIVVAKTGRKRIFGMGRVSSDYYWDDNEPEFKHRRHVQWLREDPSEFPGTGTAIKTLTEITPYPSFMELVRDYLGLTEIVDVESPEQVETEDFTVQTILDEGCFLSREEIDTILARLRTKKNIILQGPPGTGKTWLAKRLGYALFGQRDASSIKVVQFHANTTYEDFVRGYRPTPEGKLALVDGTFMDAIEDARNSTKAYVVVIEEVNRGNPAQIFGEMLTLLEADKRTPQDGVELTYQRRSTERVYIPPNLHVIGTMNIADRSLALVDLALRRRFAFIDLTPKLNAAWRDWLSSSGGFTEEFISTIEAKISKLNEIIGNDDRLGSQFRIGHSYVTPPINAHIANSKEWFLQVVQTEIRPLLLEYWFDDPETASKAVKELLRDL